MSERPIDVSVVTATYNRACILPRTYGSVRDQSPAWEWIVVDDASTDETAETLSSFSDARIVYERLPVNRGGPNPARNRGARMARGRYVVFLDDDDELYPGSLGEMVKTMDEAPRRVGVALFQCVLQGGGRWDDQIIDGAIYGEKDVVCSGVLGLEKICIYRREVFDHFALPEDLLRSDGVFVLEVSKRFDFLIVARPGRIYNPDSTSSSVARAMISVSRQIALGYERVLENHREVLRTCPDARASYATKALYRYAIAGCRADALRMFRQIRECGRSRQTVRGGAILLLALTRLAGHAERVRVALLLRRRFPSR